MKYIKVYERLTEEERIKTKEYRKKYLNKFIIFEVLNNYKLANATIIQKDKILHGFCYIISQGWLVIRGIGSIPITDVKIYNTYENGEELSTLLDMYKDMKNYNL